MKYIGFMKAMSWIRTMNDADGEYISITEKGREFAEILSAYLDGKEISSDSVGLDELQDLMGSAQLKPKAIHNESVILGHAIRRNAAEAETQNLKRKQDVKIMVVDDEPDVALTYESFLKSEGYQSIDVFHDSAKALQRFASVKPGHYDLVITDIRMGQLNGLKLYQRLKALDQAVKIIFVTALDAVEELTSMLIPEPTGIIRKPVDQERFTYYVNASLTGQESQSQS